MAAVGRHLRITGHVQGVYFRAWAHGEARELSVSGWIRNCADGSVEAHLSGEEDCVERMVERMRRGPSNARIAEVTVEEVPPEDQGRFHIRN
jgi:acylphosphatase